MARRAIVIPVFLLALQVVPVASSFAEPPLDLWPPQVMERIRNRGTLNPRIIARAGYFEVFFDSEIGDAKWADSGPPYEVHTGGTIRIHG